MFKQWAWCVHIVCVVLLALYLSMRVSPLCLLPHILKHLVGHLNPDLLKHSPHFLWCPALEEIPLKYTPGGEEWHFLLGVTVVIAIGITLRSYYRTLVSISSLQRQKECDAMAGIEANKTLIFPIWCSYTDRYVCMSGCVFYLLE